jgi:hypothetical protein
MPVRHDEPSEPSRPGLRSTGNHPERAVRRVRLHRMEREAGHACNDQGRGFGVTARRRVSGSSATATSNHLRQIRAPRVALVADARARLRGQSAVSSFSQSRPRFSISRRSG